MSSSIKRQLERDLLSTWDAFELEARLKSQNSSLVRLHLRPNHLFLNLLSVELIVSFSLAVVYFLFFSAHGSNVVDATNFLRTLLIVVVLLTVSLALLNHVVCLLRPDRLAISQNGFLLYRNLCGFASNYKNLSWEEVQSITLGLESEKEARLQIATGANGASKTLKVYMDRKKTYNLSKFAEALRTFAPRQLVADDLFEKLGIKETGAYTAMWLNELTDAQSQPRLRTGELETEFVINENYRVIKRLGSGGQGTAYLVADVNDEKGDQLVLKEFILPTHAGPEVVGRSIEMIKKEFDILSAIDSPHIVKVKDFFLYDLRAYLVLEHLDGQSLRASINETGPLTEQSAWGMADQMCNILECLHGQQRPIIHRDFSPDNLILTKSGRLCLIDFNVAQFYEGQSSKTIVGKKSYVPPEQLRGDTVPASDLYAMGATLYFIGTAKDPEPITSSHPQLLNAKLSNDFDLLVSSLTVPEVAERCKNTNDLKDRLLKRPSQFKKS
jgi:hypothetical protein